MPAAMENRRTKEALLRHLLEAENSTPDVSYEN